MFKSIGIFLKQKWLKNHEGITQWLSLAALIVTACFAIYFGFTQKEINTKLIKLGDDQLKLNLRPIILRSGILNNWIDLEKYIYKKTIKGNVTKVVIDGEPITLAVNKNIATNISGFIIVNHNKHALGFTIIATGTVIEHLGWVGGFQEPFTTFYAYPLESGASSSEKDQLVIDYCDIVKNHYQTVEYQDEKSGNFLQETIGPINNCN